MRADGKSRRSSWSWLLVFATAGLVAWGTYAWLKTGLYLIQSKESFIRAGRMHLSGAIQVWNEAGRPEGEALEEFLRQQDFNPEYVFATNVVLTIDGKQMQAIFATTRIGTPGALMVTTNREFIVVEPDREPRVFK